MGLVKTIQTIRPLLSDAPTAQLPSLVVCPPSLVLNWQSELVKFSPSLKVLVLQGKPSERHTLLNTLDEYDVIVTSYDLLSRDIALYEAFEFNYCIADEAHYIKNRRSLKFRTLKVITSKVRFALTGTPIENSLSELWSLFDFIMPGHLSSYANFQGDSGKLEACLELVTSSTAAGHKILIFSQFTSMLDILAKELSTLDISSYMLTGQTPSDQRLAMTTSFNEDDTSVFLISLKASGVGLNLTSADIVIHYDPWWNISAQNQATDRTHRIGQLKPVQVYKLITKDSIEEKIEHLQSYKSNLTEQILQQGETFLTQLSKEEILQLFTV